MTADARFSEPVVDVARAAIERIRTGSSSLALALVLSDDGFEVVRTPIGGESDGRFASISSSVQALGEAVVDELGAGAGEAVIVQASQGFVVQMRVPGQPYVLAAHFRTGDNLGTAMSFVRLAAQEIAENLGGSPSADPRLPSRYSAPVVPGGMQPASPTASGFPGF